MSATKPNHGEGSQAERTSLAWSRTLIGLSAMLGFLAVHAGLGGAPVASVVTLGVLATIALASTSVAPRRRLDSATKGLAGQGPATSPAPMAVLAAITVTLAAVSLVLVFQDWR